MSLNSLEKLSDLSEEEQEPLGYHHYLYDVNIEYSPGGSRSHVPSERHCFKLKCLPYMIVGRTGTNFGDNVHTIVDVDTITSTQHQQIGIMPQTVRKDSIASSDSNTFNEDDQSFDSPSSHKQTSSPSQIIDYPMIDVTKATCAFLGNSDYVPNANNGRRRVVIEIISAKLSQAATLFPNIPQSSGYTSLASLAERAETSSSHVIPSERLSQLTTPTSNGLLTTRLHRLRQEADSNISLTTTPTPSYQKHIVSTSSTHTPASASKRFVNYTLLIKTVPGLDKHPAVIERRFSDFLALYQGLKSQEPFARLVDQHVTFPKKVYLGNFSLTNIAERSIGFSRLLNLCVSNDQLLRSVPFITFLMDKELKEAHRLSTCGDPDDVQALLETAHNINQKLYLSCNEMEAQISCDASRSS